MSGEDLVAFPCELPIKVVGRNDAAFRGIANSIVRKHYTDIKASRVREQPSRNGAYVSLTFVVHAQSREEVDALYRDLTSTDEIVMVL
jgi:putative lipoic acid-binding regulatory protein